MLTSLIGAVLTSTGYLAMSFTDKVPCFYAVLCVAGRVLCVGSCESCAVTNAREQVGHVPSDGGVLHYRGFRRRGVLPWRPLHGAQGSPRLPRCVPTHPRSRVRASVLTTTRVSAEWPAGVGVALVGACMSISLALTNGIVACTALFHQLCGMRRNERANGSLIAVSVWA